MAGKIQPMTIILMTTILLTGGIVPYTFANSDDDEGEEYVETQADKRCETPSKLRMKYTGPDGALVEIYKKPGQAKNSNKMIYAFPQTFNNGDMIELDSKEHMDRDQLKTKTTYKIINGDKYSIIPVDTSCETPMKIGDDHKRKGTDGVMRTLTIMYGGDTDGDDVIYEKYYSKKNRQDPKCEAPNIELNFEAANLFHGSQVGDIDSYLDSKGLGNIEISTIDIEKEPPIIFNTDESGTSDPDLEVDEGNIVIRAENIVDNVNNDSENPPPDGLIDDPDDATSQGTVTFDFDVPLTIHSFRWIDLDYGEDATAIVYGLDQDGNPTIELDREDVDHDGRNTGNGEATFVPFHKPVDNVAKLVFEYSSSGGFTDICVQPSPEPTGTIKITKITRDANGNVVELPDDFEFSGDLGLFTLDTDEANEEYPSMRISQKPLDASYTVKEGPALGFSLSNIECLDEAGILLPDIVADLPNRNVAIPLTGELDFVECKFTNDKIPPTGTIIIKKAITNDNGRLAIPENFKVTLTKNGGSNPEVETFATIDVDTTMGMLKFEDIPIGTYVLTETYDGPDGEYNTVLIAGDTACPSMENEEFSLNEGDEFTCVIYNDDNFVPGGNEGDPPTMKITVEIRNLEGVLASDFEYSVGTDGIIYVDGSTVNTIPTNTPVEFKQTNFIDTSDPNNPPILPTSIEGDGNCPDVIGTGGTEKGFVTLSANQDIECIIVYGKIVEPGVIFHFDSVKFDQNGSPDSLDNCDVGDGNSVPGSVVLPCAFEDTNGIIQVVPNLNANAGEKLQVSTLVLFDLIGLDPLDATKSNPVATSGCVFEGLSEVDFDVDADQNPLTQPENVLISFQLQCANIQGDPDDTFRINFALIETLMPGEQL